MRRCSSVWVIAYGRQGLKYKALREPSDFGSALVSVLSRVRYGDRVAYLRNDLGRPGPPELAFLLALPTA